MPSGCQPRGSWIRSGGRRRRGGREGGQARGRAREMPTRRRTVVIPRTLLGEMGALPSCVDLVDPSTGVSGRGTSGTCPSVVVMTNNRHPVGAPVRRHRDRAPRRRAGPTARHLSLEGRRPRRRRAAHHHRRLHPDPRRAAQAPRRRRGLPLHRQAERRPWAGRGRRCGWDGSNDWEFGPRRTTRPSSSTPSTTAPSSGPGRSLDAALADGGLDQPIHVTDPEGNHASLRRLVVDLIEEYGRHTGHADLIREAVDGRAGEDPPAGWEARSGRFRPTTMAG